MKPPKFLKKIEKETIYYLESSINCKNNNYIFVLSNGFEMTVSGSRVNKL